MKTTTLQPLRTAPRDVPRGDRQSFTCPPWEKLIPPVYHTSCGRKKTSDGPADCLVTDSWLQCLYKYYCVNIYFSGCPNFWDVYSMHTKLLFASVSGVLQSIRLLISPSAARGRSRYRPTAGRRRWSCTPCRFERAAQGKNGGKMVEE